MQLVLLCVVVMTGLGLSFAPTDTECCPQAVWSGWRQAYHPHAAPSNLCSVQAGETIQHSAAGGQSWEGEEVRVGRGRRSELGGGGGQSWEGEKVRVGRGRRSALLNASVSL